MSLRALLVGLTLALAGTASAQGVRSDYRPMDDGFLYLGSAPGVSIGGNSLPRSLYMDVLQAGYVFSSGLDLSMALSGMNFVPDEGDYAISMGRFSVGWRPFLRDPLPMIQPYAFAGAGFGGEGKYLCEAEPDCDPERNECRNVCGRANWVGDMFLGGGIDFNTFVMDVAGQQLLFYAGVQARYEYIPARYSMAVVTLPIGLRLQ